MAVTLDEMRDHRTKKNWKKNNPYWYPQSQPDNAFKKQRNRTNAHLEINISIMEIKMLNTVGRETEGLSQK